MKWLSLAILVQVKNYTKLSMIILTQSENTSSVFNTQE